MRVALVSNGARVDAGLAARIEKSMVSAGADAMGFRTTRANETGVLVRGAIEAGATRIVVAGGDGTVHEAGNALFGTGMELAVLPAGSGNDYARSLGVPIDLETAIEFAIRSPALATDLGELTCAMPGGSTTRRCFLNIAQAGFGADVVRHSRTTVKLAPAWLAYQLAIFASLATLRTEAVTLSTDGGEPQPMLSTDLIVGLGQYFGAGLHPLPDANLDDGLFEVAHITGATRLDIARHAPLLRNGIPHGHPKVLRAQCRELRVEGPASVPVEADGELAGCLPAVFKVLPGALRVVRKA